MAGQIWSTALMYRILHVRRGAGAQAGLDAQKCFLGEGVAAERSKERVLAVVGPEARG